LNDLNKEILEQMATDHTKVVEVVVLVKQEAYPKVETDFHLQ
jgi:hypothetical protein